MVDKTVRMNLLFDFYGQLLTPKQRTLFTLYYHDDLSLGEIAAQHGVSRQAVYDILKRSERSLEELEEKLGLVHRYQRQRQLLVGIREELAALAGAVRAAGSDRVGDGALARIQRLTERIESLLADEEEEPGSE